MGDIDLRAKVYERAYSLSGSTGAYVTSSGGYTTVISLGITITRVRPIRISLISDNSGNESQLKVQNITGVDSLFRWLVNSGVMAVHNISANSTTHFVTMAPSFPVLYYFPGAVGGYTFDFQVRTRNADAIFVQYVRMFLEET